VNQNTHEHTHTFSVKLEFSISLIVKQLNELTGISCSIHIKKQDRNKLKSLLRSYWTACKRGKQSFILKLIKWNSTKKSAQLSNDLI